VKINDLTKFNFNEIESIEPLLTAMEEILTFSQNPYQGVENG
jgi:hypothetical protein